MAKVVLHARAILRTANRLGINMKHRGFNTCAVGVLAQSRGIDGYASRAKLARKLGRNTADIVALEMGFEGWSNGHPVVGVMESRTVRRATKNAEQNPYYKVGRNLARIVGRS